MADVEKKPAAVYVSWKTFQNSVDALSKGELPNIIDKTVFPGMAFSVQNQLFAGMRFLGLIDENNRPTTDLEELTTPVEERRKDKLKHILQQRYADLFALNLKKTTPDEMERKMAESYGVGGATKEKAVRFFMGAAEYLGIELSSLLSPPKKGNSGKQPVSRKRGSKKATFTPATSGKSSEGTGTSKTVRLQSGGTLTLSATLDLFALNPNDRKFVFDLIDQLDGYQQPTATLPEAVTEIAE